MPVERRQVPFRLPLEASAEVRALCAAHGITVQAFLEALVNRFLAAYKRDDVRPQIREFLSQAKAIDAERRRRDV